MSDTSSTLSSLNSQTALMPTEGQLKKLPPEVFNSIWTVYYRHGINAILQKNFYHEGSMVSAIERAKKHCTIMGYRYHYVRPMVPNINIEEERKLKGMPDQAI